MLVELASLCLITSLQFEEGVSNELSRGLLQLEIRSQDSPFIADVLVVERVRWVKTFAQHATLGVLEVAYKNEIRGLINCSLLDHSAVHNLTSDFSATGRQQILFSTQAGRWEYPESATRKSAKPNWLEQRLTMDHVV